MYFLIFSVKNLRIREFITLFHLYIKNGLNFGIPFPNTDFTNLTDVLDDMFHFIGRTSKSELLRFFKQNKTFAQQSNHGHDCHLKTNSLIL